VIIYSVIRQNPASDVIRLHSTGWYEATFTTEVIELLAIIIFFRMSPVFNL